jgi:2-methylisocitrate lyase-like PEP mutase family enzyme
VETLCAKITAIRERVLKKGADLFINARTDVYLRGLVDRDNRVDETLQRAAKYQRAGADGIFIPALVDAIEIKQVCEKIALPVNVMAMPGLPDGTVLAQLG